MTLQGGGVARPRARGQRSRAEGGARKTPPAPAPPCGPPGLPQELTAKAGGRRRPLTAGGSPAGGNGCRPPLPGAPGPRHRPSSVLPQPPRPSAGLAVGRSSSASPVVTLRTRQRSPLREPALRAAQGRGAERPRAAVGAGRARRLWPLSGRTPRAADPSEQPWGSRLGIFKSGGAFPPGQPLPPPPAPASQRRARHFSNPFPAANQDPAAHSSPDRF